MRTLGPQARLERPILLESLQALHSTQDTPAAAGPADFRLRPVEPLPDCFKSVTMINILDNLNGYLMAGRREIEETGLSSNSTGPHFSSRNFTVNASAQKISMEPLSLQNNSTRMTRLYFYTINSATT